MTAAAVLFVGSFSIAGLAILAGVLPLLYPERGTQMSFMVQALVLLVSGVYYQVEVLPGWLQIFSHVSPATYILDGIRGGIIDGNSLADTWPTLVALVIFGDRADPARHRRVHGRGAVGEENRQAQAPGLGSTSEVGGSMLDLGSVSLSDLTDRLERAFPDLRPVGPLREIGRGFRSVAYETPGGFVVRLGHSPDALADYEKERRIGPWLVAQFGSLVPDPRWFAPSSDELPHGAIAYRKHDGTQPRWGSDPGTPFARDLGAFMAKLHTLPVDDALAADVREVDSYERVLGARPVVAPVLCERLAEAQFVRVENWWEQFAADERMRTIRRAVCHHDLWHDNLLASGDGRLAAVLDLAHVEITDPAHDFAAPRYFGERFLHALLTAYREHGGAFDEDDAHRARRYWEARELGGLAWAVEHDNEAELNDSLDKLVRGPILCGKNDR